MKKRFLFICGCARSGTSALVQLLSGSEEIVLSMERFGHLVRKGEFKLKRSLFEKNAFFEVRKGETFYDDFDSRHKFDPRMREKYDECKYIGDKRPELYLVYDELFTEFPESKVLFIFRDVREVASSYEGRILTGENWPATKNSSMAVIEWNQSLHFTKLGIEKGYEIKVLEYRDVFLSEMSLEPIFDYLDVRYTEQVRDHIAKVRKRALLLQSKRTMLLSQEQDEYVTEHAKEFLITELKSSRLI